MKKFDEDLQKLYNYTKTRQTELSKFYNNLDDTNSGDDKQLIIDSFLNDCDIEITKEARLAVATRIVTLRDDQLAQLFKQEGFDESTVNRLKEKAYLLASAYHIELFRKTFSFIEKEELFTPFYRTYLRGIHDIGLAFTAWQSRWTAHIINDINVSLLEEHKAESDIYTMIKDREFIDKDADGSNGDRAYSALIKVNGEYQAKSYAQVFVKEVADVVVEISMLVSKLERLDDAIYDQKEEIINYLETIKDALIEENRDNLIAKWADVDRAWMKVTIPFQPGHPLEYYEDKYRKAVALEWDIRLQSPLKRDSESVKQNIKSFYKTLFEEINTTQRDVLENTLYNIDRVQLYIGRPLFYYGANFLGLFSAQVVPNDENVTKEYGKKIFAYADNVLASIQAKPFMKIQDEVFGEEFMKKERQFVFQKEQMWHSVYDITTLGHEYGHILWLDGDTESMMNKNGAFKNIEEFKATSGGLMAFFANEDDKLRAYVFSDLIKRAVGLIAWMETSEVEAYYCEGLIHLHGLFSAGVLDFKNKLSIDMSDDAYSRLKVWYKDAYTQLGKHYLAKKDAKEFLDKYAVKKEGVYKPTDPKVKYFVNYYWNLYQDIGMEVDDSSNKKLFMED